MKALGVILSLIGLAAGATLGLFFGAVMWWNDHWRRIGHDSGARHYWDRSVKTQADAGPIPNPRSTDRPSAEGDNLLREQNSEYEQRDASDAEDPVPPAGMEPATELASHADSPGFRSVFVKPVFLRP